ncbi:hypothetical protein Hanom_Chr16g01504901 [Helianthus anomalus]
MKRLKGTFISQDKFYLFSSIESHKASVTKWWYLFVRCDNNPAAWTRSAIALLQRGIDVIERKGPPYWDYDV